MTTELGERLRRERRRRQETQAQAAEYFGVRQPSYYRWEAGETVPDPDRLGLIAEYLGCEIQEVWSMLHDGPIPTSLEGVRTEVRELRRNYEDFAEARAEIAELRETVNTLSNDVKTLTEVVAVLKQVAESISDEPPARPSRTTKKATPPARAAAKKTAARAGNGVTKGRGSPAQARRRGH